MTEAASGIIWLQTTYSLNILKMTEGRIMSTGGDTPIIDTHQSVHKMVFEDLNHAPARACTEHHLTNLNVQSGRGSGPRRTSLPRPSRGS